MSHNRMLYHTIMCQRTSLFIKTYYNQLLPNLTTVRVSSQLLMSSTDNLYMHMLHAHVRLLCPEKYDATAIYSF